jgi:hypothetical protein
MDQHKQRDHGGQDRPADAGSDDAYAHINGWGADLERANRPAYPMERRPPRLEGVHRHQPQDQPLKVKVFHSTERPGVTPIFGTSAPPSGVSGKLRAAAYQLSENDVRHWLMLLLADRVNVVEGLGQDLARGHVPNIFAEMGMRAEWQHNRAGLVRKVAVGTALAGVAYYLLRRRNAR